MQMSMQICKWYVLVYTSACVQYIRPIKYIPLEGLYLRMHAPYGINHLTETYQHT